jgi:aminoglycoside phosphotransferase (APT) family kinase protein
MTRHADPALADVAAVRDLSGLSGAEIYLVSRDQVRWFVRKVASTAESSARLRLQHAKQLAFAASGQDALRVPRVLGAGEVDGRFWFDMEFIRGADGASHLRQATYAQVRAFADRLCAFIEHAAASPPLTTSGSAGLFTSLYARVAEVARRVPGLPAEVLSRVMLALEPLAQLAPAPTLCHGDLTLENLVVDDQGQVWAFDLLDPPFDHYWLDVAKLHQDLDGGWFRLKQERIGQCVLEYVGRRLREVAARLEPRHAQVHAILLATTFLRILPYARDERARQFVMARVEHYARLARPEL